MKKSNVPYIAKYLTEVNDNKESVKMSTFETECIEPVDKDEAI